MGVYIALLSFITLFLVAHEKKMHVNISVNQVNNFKKKRIISQFVIICILGLFSGTRDGIGIDYSSYLIHIKQISLGYPNYMEFGFRYLSKFVMVFFDDPKAVIVTISFLTVYFFVSSIYYQSSNVTMSVFLFLTWGYYFFTFNTIRNYFALALVFFSLKYIFEKKYLKFIFFVILASLFHKSALVCLPVYLLVNRKFSKSTYLYLVLGAMLLYLIKAPMREVAFWIYPVYENSVYDAGRVSVLNIAKSLLVLFYGLLYYKIIKDNHKLMVYFNLNAIALIIYTALYWLPEISRVGFYFNIVSIVFISNLTTLINVRDQMIAKYIIYSISMILFVLLMREFYNPTVQLLPYRSWIFK
ncbi:EpsG family protein [Paenibacillus sp. FSL R7-0331]|uniref:EpsG family protein n=1 Tax=Paenibacillus sp. FSL R7-0331 TaxID=1536773 RepID=UPI0004F59CCF|nr:EpsG family protein [Paenibacillus sp. FSL R7-0331]AIQ54436.1 hypothetical protein R70331_24880 [Paenibacillus sp. FSL R7-0331]